MIKVTLKNIEDFDLPLDNTDKVLERGTSKEVLKRLEKSHKAKTHEICSKSSSSKYVIYEDPRYKHIAPEDKHRWLTNYEVYVRSSFTYKFWIAVYCFITAFEQ